MTDGNKNNNLTNFDLDPDFLRKIEDTFNSADWPAPKLNFTQAYGYICFLVTVPMIIQADEWLEQMQNDWSVEFKDPAEGALFAQTLADLYNFLNQSLIQNEYINLPNAFKWDAESEPEIPRDVLDWCNGFDKGGESFSHLWEFWLSSLEKSLVNDADKLKAMSPVLDEIWESLNTQWQALTNFTDKEKIESAYEAGAKSTTYEKFQDNVFSHVVPIWGEYCTRSFEAIRLRANK